MAKEKNIKVIVVEPGKKATVQRIKNDLANLQAAVNGYIECIYPFDDDVCIICNDEGKMNGSLPNRVLRDEDGSVYEVICGTFIIADCSSEDFSSLSDDFIERYLHRFEYPETIFLDGNEIIAIKYDPQEDV